MPVPHNRRHPGWQARCTRHGEVELQTKAFVEEATRLRLLVAETKAGGAGERLTSRLRLMESLRGQSAAMAASMAESAAR